MNNILTNTRKGLVIVALFISTLSFANETSIYSINVEASKTTLTLNYAKQGTALAIKDASGSVLYSETIKATGRYKKAFDLNFLPNGNYFFELDKDLEIKEIPFTLKSGVAKFNEEKVVYKPFIRVEGDLVYVSKLAVDGEPLDVKIYFTEKHKFNATLVVADKLKANDKIEKLYKLTGKNKGEYQIILHSANRTFTKNI